MLLLEIFDRPPLAKMRKLDGLTPEMLAKNADLVKTVLANRLTLGQTEELMGKLTGNDLGEEDTEFQLDLAEKLAKSVLPKMRASYVVTRLGNRDKTKTLDLYRRLPRDQFNARHFIRGRLGFVGNWIIEMTFKDERPSSAGGKTVPPVVKTVRIASPEEGIEQLKKFYDMWEKRGWEK